MKTLCLLTLVAHLATADLCGEGSTLDKGNWYCQAVERIAYKNVGGSGSYDRIVGMDSATGKCDTVKQPFSGPLAPLDEDLSIHFRGPLVLKQFAVYNPSKTQPKRATLMQHLGHAHVHEAEKRAAAAAAAAAVGDVVTATINGEVVSWINQYDGRPPPSASDRDPEVWVTATINGKVVSWVNNYYPTKTAGKDSSTTSASSTSVKSTTVATTSISPTPLSSSTSTTIGGSFAVTSSTEAVETTDKPDGTRPPTKQLLAAPGDWQQVAYYSMDNKTAEGVTFLNSMGGQGSGVWDQTFGNSLSYASSDARAGTASPQVFNGKLESAQEIAVFSGTSCNDGDCGFVRPGTVAYRGFAGVQKAFFFEFQMPDDGKSGFNANMPGIWVLNGQIPRTQQYGSCSCWASGCGEFDIFETLATAKSTFHKRNTGGSSDYFERPVDGFIKLAVVMSGDTVTVQRLKDDYEFSQIISDTKMSEIGEETNVSPGIGNSIFKFGD